MDNADILRRRKAFQIAQRLGLDRDDRLELARVLLWCDVESWKDLDDSQIRRILDALEGFALVNYILTVHNPLPQPTPE